MTPSKKTIRNELCPDCMYYVHQGELGSITGDMWDFETCWQLCWHRAHDNDIGATHKSRQLTKGQKLARKARRDK